ncbi:C39 family peptidase [Bremerella sp. JC770]|uniref:C39 family peptidase n=1 Tax=Bremerella sp. JC770 TaxID=3232137 RepID=UPI003458FE08
MKNSNTVILAVVLVLGAYAASAQGQVSYAPVRDAPRNFQVHVKSWTAFRDQNVVKQQRDFSCGAAALATICRYYWGDNVTENQVLKIVEGNLTREELQERFQNGLAISDLRLAAVKMGYLSTIGKLTIAKLHEAKIPLVVAIRLEETDHFVVVRGIRNGWVYLADPIRGNIRMPLWDFEDRWIENAVLVVVKKGKTKSDVSRLGITHAEMSKGWLNDQVLRTFPEKTFVNPRHGFP